jgi:hypothetical protein
MIQYSCCNCRHLFAEPAKEGVALAAAVSLLPAFNQQACWYRESMSLTWLRWSAPALAARRALLRVGAELGADSMPSCGAVRRLLFVHGFQASHTCNHPHTVFAVDGSMVLPSSRSSIVPPMLTIVITPW